MEVKVKAITTSQSSVFVLIFTFQPLFSLRLLPSAVSNAILHTNETNQFIIKSSLCLNS